MLGSMPDPTSSSRLSVNGIEIAYETIGDRDAEPVVLIMGLGTQLVGWPDEFCAQLQTRGFFVVRFDNRDIGLSTHLDWLPVPNVLAVAVGRRRPAYPLDDLATDTAGLIDALGLGRVHLVGASMGSFVAQLVAIRRPDLVRSLTLMMTSTGYRWIGRPTASVLSATLRRKAAISREEAIAASVRIFRMIGSPGYPFDEGMIRELAGRSYDRGYDPAGQRRQLGAVAAQTDRTRRLAQLTVPTVVMHGLADPLVNVSGGLAVARAVPRARFVGFSGMGHDLPRLLWPAIVAEIDAVAARSR
jgi:pimeloyl-ACP methyl ester carboxylesterase